MNTSTRLAAVFTILAAMMGMMFLPACCSVPLTPDQRLTAEFNWNRPTWRTSKYNIPVAFPTWLKDPIDRVSVLKRVDSYAACMEEHYPWARDNFDFSRYTIWIHDNLGAFIAGSPSSNLWAIGWRIGEYCVVAWDLRRGPDGRPAGPAMDNIFPALVHEWFHALFDERYGWSDPGHYFYFPMLEVQMALVRTGIDASFFEPLILSDESLWQALHFRYHPWIFPAQVQ